MRRSRRNRLVWFQLQANSYQYEIALCAVSHIGRPTCQKSLTMACEEYPPLMSLIRVTWSRFAKAKIIPDRKQAKTHPCKSRRPQRDYFGFAGHMQNDTEQAGTLWIAWKRASDAEDCSSLFPANFESRSSNN
jgi:hypothetical protein